MSNMFQCLVSGMLMYYMNNHMSFFDIIKLLYMDLTKFCMSTNLGMSYTYKYQANDSFTTATNASRTRKTNARSTEPVDN